MYWTQIDDFFTVPSNYHLQGSCPGQWPLVSSYRTPFIYCATATWQNSKGLHGCMVCVLPCHCGMRVIGRHVMVTLIWANDLAASLPTVRVFGLESMLVVEARLIHQRLPSAWSSLLRKSNMHNSRWKARRHFQLGWNVWFRPEGRSVVRGTGWSHHKEASFQFDFLWRFTSLQRAGGLAALVSFPGYSGTAQILGLLSSVEI